MCEIAHEDPPSFCRIIQPVLLGKLLLYFDPAYGMSSEIAYLYATGLLLALIAYIFTHHQYFLLSYHIGMQMRVAACSAIYSKVNSLPVPSTKNVEILTIC